MNLDRKNVEGSRRISYLSRWNHKELFFSLSLFLSFSLSLFLSFSLSIYLWIYLCLFFKNRLKVNLENLQRIPSVEGLEMIPIEPPSAAPYPTLPPPPSTHLEESVKLR